MLGLHQELFHKDVLVAERLEGFRLDEVEVCTHFFHGVAAAHASAAASGRSLQDDGETELHGEFLGLFPALEGFCGAGRRGNAALQRHLLGGQFVAHHVQDLAGRADKLDAGVFAGLGEIAVLRQETVARVDGIRAVLLREMDDGGDIQIGTQRTVVLSYQVGFVRRGAE